MFAKAIPPQLFGTIEGRGMMSLALAKTDWMRKEKIGHRDILESRNNFWNCRNRPQGFIATKNKKMIFQEDDFRSFLAQLTDEV